MRLAKIALAALTGLAFASCTAVDDRPATWSYISTAIIEPSCGTAGCHSSLTRTAGVVLDTREAGYRSLTGGDMPFVIPGNLEESRLVHLLLGDATYRMPPDAPLLPEDVALIERWIEDLARDN